MAGKRRYCYDYPRPMVTVDCALFRLRRGAIELLMVRRGRRPYKGAWALPGGFIKIKESLETAVVREVAEETGIDAIPFLIQYRTYGKPGRDPRGRVVSVSYVGIVAGHDTEPKAGDDAAEAAWFRIEELPDPIAFDHPMVIGDALHEVAALGTAGDALFAFLKGPFTEADVRELLKAVYGIERDPREYLAPFLETGVVCRARARGKYRFAGRACAKRKRT